MRPAYQCEKLSHAQRHLDTEETIQIREAAPKMLGELFKWGFAFPHEA